MSKGEVSLQCRMLRSLAARYQAPNRALRSLVTATSHCAQPHRCNPAISRTHTLDTVQKNRQLQHLHLDRRPGSSFALAVAQREAQAEVGDSSDNTLFRTDIEFTTSGGESRSEAETSTSGREEFCVVNFYHLTDIAKPGKLISLHRKWLEGKNIHGRIYITTQGINAQFSGPREDAREYAEWVAQQPEFQGLRWTSDPVDGHQFPRLRLKFRENLVQLAGGTTSLPLSDPQARAEAVQPGEWREMLRQAVAPSSSDTVRPVVLDVRNSYEWDGGHFAGAERPAEAQFNQTPTDAVPRTLENVAKDTPVMMYCTGGIRCDIYSAVLKQQGYQTLYTLHGGIANYLREVGPENWEGSMFTFDNRLAVAPDGKTLNANNLTAAAPCKVCGGSAELPHMNCANIDCNKLFLACPTCRVDLKGCCSKDCLEAPRMLRPLKSSGPYDRWHTLAEGEEKEALKHAMQAGRGEGRRLRQQRRLERLRLKRAEFHEEKMRRKRVLKDYMARLEADKFDVKEVEEMEERSPLQKAA